MSIIGKIFGMGGEAAAKPIEAIGTILDNIFTSKDEKLTHKEVRMRIAQAPTMVQNEINKIEAQHRKVFVSGWRPFIGWVCGFALFYNYIVKDIANYIIVLWGPEKIELLPSLQMEHLMTVLMGMLGLATLRTYEKKQGLTK